MDQFRFEKLIAAGTGAIDLKTFGALEALESGAPVLQPQPNALGVRPIQMITDVNDDTVVAGNLYWIPRGGKKIRARVLRETFGAGNIMDTYYRLWYLDESLNENFIVIDGRGGLFQPATYPSELVPITTEGDSK